MPPVVTAASPDDMYSDHFERSLSLIYLFRKTPECTRIEVRPPGLYRKFLGDINNFDVCIISCYAKKLRSFRSLNFWSSHENSLTTPILSTTLNTPPILSNFSTFIIFTKHNTFPPRKVCLAQKALTNQITKWQNMVRKKKMHGISIVSYLCIILNPAPIIVVTG